MEALGRHVLLELRDCNAAKLDDLPLVRETMLNAAVETGATVVGEIFHQFSPEGVRGVGEMGESHLCIQTWPEHGYAAVDSFTCGVAFDPTEAARLIIERLESASPEITEVIRGVLDVPATVLGA